MPVNLNLCLSWVLIMCEMKPALVVFLVLATTNSVAPEWSTSSSQGKLDHQVLPIVFPCPVLTPFKNLVNWVGEGVRIIKPIDQNEQKNSGYPRSVSGNLCYQWSPLVFHVHFGLFL